VSSSSTTVVTTELSKSDRDLNLAGPLTEQTSHRRNDPSLVEPASGRYASVMSLRSDGERTLQTVLYGISTESL
jgi:hypothetical protein